MARLKDPAKACRNTELAIPRHDQRPISFREIWFAAPSPSLPRDQTKWFLESLVFAGKVEATDKGRTRLYRLASRVPRNYNDPAPKACPLDGQVNHFLQALYPLRQGKPVHLWMTLPERHRGKLRAGVKESRKLVVIAPGPNVGFPADTMLCSILGAGSSAIPVHGPSKAADLVLAGMPAALANELINAITQVFDER